MNHELCPRVVEASERLARFVLFSKWIRGSDQTVKPDAFIPHPYPNLSVTRHKGLSESKLWRAGQDIADKRPATLHGRADIKTGTARKQSLEVVPEPTENNPNHAHINGWPPDKPGQKSIAQELAAQAAYVSNPGIDKPE